jgi:hypothetical protein
MNKLARWTAVCWLLSLSACAGLGLPQSPGRGQGTPTTPPPTETSSLATLATVWFPATFTPTAYALTTPTQTPEQRPGLGPVTFSDDFSDPSLWDIASSDQGSASVENNRLTLAVQPGVYFISLRHNLVLDDFYAEITARTSLCRSADDYGLLIRAVPVAYYRYALSCDGNVRLERVSVSERHPLYARTPSADAPSGAPAEVRLGVWAVGPEMRFFLNGRYQFTVSDPNLSSGTLGVFARSAGDTAVTVSFSDLTVHSVFYVAPTVTPTGTPTPPSTGTPGPTP